MKLKRGHLIRPLRDAEVGFTPFTPTRIASSTATLVCLLPTTTCTIVHFGLDGLGFLSHDSLVPVCLGTSGCTTPYPISPSAACPGPATHPSPRATHRLLASQTIVGLCSQIHHIPYAPSFIMSNHLNPGGRGHGLTTDAGRTRSEGKKQACDSALFLYLSLVFAYACCACLS